MVHVEVEEIELQLRFPVLELAPGANAGTCGIPSFPGLLGSLRQPEVAMLHQLHLVLVVEDGLVLSFVNAVLAPYADVSVVGQQALHVIQLWFQHLLSAEDVGMLEVQLGTDDGASLLPSVAGFGVAVVLIAYVVRAHVERLGACRDDGSEKEEEKFFHFIQSQWCSWNIIYER